VSLPVVLHYRSALDEFRGEGHEPPVLKRMSELISLLDLATTPGSSLDATGTEILESALLVVMGELQVSRAALYVAEGEGALRLRASRGLRPRCLRPWRLGWRPPRRSSRGPRHGARRLRPRVPGQARRDGPLALLGLGPPPDRPAFGAEEQGFLEPGRLRRGSASRTG
jgi:hypothetical protein